MRKAKYFIIFLVIFGSLFFLFSPGVFPENYQFQQLLNLAAQNDVIIIFNSGGWGNTPLEEAKDFAPIIKGIQETLKREGYNSIVIPYERTKDSFFGKITGAKDFLNSFQTSSEILAEKIEFLTENLPDKKIVLAGLSTGGALVAETMEKISNQAKNSVYPIRQNLSNRVYAITAGVPFWQKTFESENILLLDNYGKDTLAVGDVKSLILSLIKLPLSSQKGQIAVGHSYFWDSPGVGPKIVSFLEDKMK